MNRRKTLLLQSLFFAAVLAAMLFSLNGWTRGPLRTQLLEEKEQVIRLMLPKLEATLKESDFTEPRNIIGALTRDLRGHFSILRIMVLDPKGRILASTESNPDITVEHAPEAIQILSSRHTDFFITSAEKALNLIISEPGPGPARGGAMIAFSSDDIESACSDFIIKSGLIASFFLFVLFLVDLFKFHSLAAACTDLRRGFSFLRDGIHAFEPRAINKGDAGRLISDYRSALSAQKSRDGVRKDLIEKSKSLAVLRSREKLQEQLFSHFSNILDTDQQILLEISDEALVVVGQTGYDSTFVSPGEVYATEEDVFNEALEFGRPLLLDDPSEVHQNLRYRTVLSKSGVTAIFPLTLGNEVAGLLHVARPREKGLFTPSEMEVGALLTGGAAISLLHLNFNQDALSQIEFDTAIPKIRLFRETPSIAAGAIPLPSAGSWAEWFALGSERGSDITLICASSDRLALRNPIRQKLEGMLGMADQLKRQMGNLSFFSLATLLRMPANEERDRLLDLFKQTPFTAEGILELSKTVLGKEVVSVRLDVIRFDAKREIFQPALYNLDLFQLYNGEATRYEGQPMSFKPGMLYTTLPEGLFKPEELLAAAKNPSLETFLSSIRSQVAELSKETPGALIAPAALAVMRA